MVPELILVITAYPYMSPSVIFQTSAGGKDTKGVMPIRPAGGEVDAAYAHHILDVRTEVAIAVPGVDRPAQAGVLAHPADSSGTVIVDIVPCGLNAQTV